MDWSILRIKAMTGGKNTTPTSVPAGSPRPPQLTAPQREGLEKRNPAWN